LKIEITPISESIAVPCGQILKSLKCIRLQTETITPMNGDNNYLLTPAQLINGFPHDMTP